MRQTQRDRPPPLTLIADAEPPSGTAYTRSTIAISTATPPAAPRLQRPHVIGTLPSAPLVFTIPATGRAPLRFSATGLPEGLTLEPASGIISGISPAAGAYLVDISVTSSAGSTSATYTLASGDALALTPPMGWNSYDSFGSSVTEADMLEQAQAVKTYLQPFGWNTVVIDYRWYEPAQCIDANGRYLPAPSKYPSAKGDTGFRSLADSVHAMGLSFGIHIMRGVPRVAYEANLPIAGSMYTTRDAGDPSDACPWDTHMWGVRGDTPAGQAWYDALFQQYAAWGVDFVKVDDMLNNSTRVYHQAEAEAIRRAVEKTGRSIVLSFSPGSDDHDWPSRFARHLNQNANMWRVTNDFWDYNALTDLAGVFKAAETWQEVTGLARGHWPDLDMLPLGYLGPRNEWHPSGATTLSENEQVTILSLWAMLPSPLMFGGNPANLGSDPWTLALLTNEEILSVNQDVLGSRGQRVAMPAGEMWVRELTGDRRAVAFFNRTAANASMAVSFAELDIRGTPAVRDLWRRANVAVSGEVLHAEVPTGGALVYVLSSADTAGVRSAGGTSRTGRLR